MSSLPDVEALEALALSRTWFYPFRLPSGRTTPSYDGGWLDGIHHTRSQMLDDVLDQGFKGREASATAIDLACHQGWFSCQLAQRGFSRVVGVDARAEHIADAGLIRDTLGLNRVELRQSDVHAIDTKAWGQFDVCLVLGLIYHLENPVGALRVARALTRRVCVIETQVVPNMSGMVDYGSYKFVRPLKGSFGIIDEVDDTHGPEASTTGICLVPSTEALMWILRKIGFSRVELLTPPADAYEQLKYGKRVMVAAWVD
ncbi:MAG: methyltransferase domain-containing protein [Pseudomonadota bacterium]|nr:methyltransferase domain-containing protein [Pseudomonadota bacterium]